MIRLNEAKIAEHILETGKLSKDVGSDIALLARYFVQKQGMTKKPAIAALDSFLTKSNVYYNRVRTIDFIEKVVKDAKKRPLLELSGIPITKSEMEYIQKLNGVRQQRVAFVLLCHAKFNNLKNGKDGNWSNTSVEDLFSEARVPVTSAARLKILREMYISGVFTMGKRVDSTSMKVEFIDNDSEVVLLITDTRELAYEYMRYCGENIVACKECGRLFKGNKQNNKILCGDCLLSSKDYYEPMVNKIVKCLDCGEEFRVEPTSRAIRCDACKLIRKRQQSSKSMKKIRKINS